MPSFKISVKMPDMKKFDSEEFIKRIEEKQRSTTGPELKKLFQKTVEGWQTKPTFGEWHTRTSSAISTRVATVSGIMKGSEIYALVSKGSPPHTILPKTARFLRYQTGYRAATSPGSIESRAYQRFGASVLSKRVNHPGFEGREFDKTIGEMYKPDFEKDMQDAMKD